MQQINIFAARFSIPPMAEEMFASVYRKSARREGHKSGYPDMQSDAERKRRAEANKHSVLMALDEPRSTPEIARIAGIEVQAAYHTLVKLEHDGKVIGSDVGDGKRESRVWQLGGIRRRPLPKKAQQILDILAGPMSREEIASVIGSSDDYTSNLIGVLRVRGLVAESGFKASPKGNPVKLWVRA